MLALELILFGSLLANLHRFNNRSPFSLFGNINEQYEVFLYRGREYPWDGRAICVQSDGIASQCHGLSSEPF